MGRPEKTGVRRLQELKGGKRNVSGEERNGKETNEIVRRQAENMIDKGDVLESFEGYLTNKTRYKRDNNNNNINNDTERQS